MLTVSEQILGAEALEAMFASLDDDDREMLRYKVLHTGWYPISLYRRLFRALLESSGRGEELARQVGADAIRRDVTGLYRVVFRVFSPETVFGLASKLYSQYYDTGQVTVEGTRGSARLVYEGCAGFDGVLWAELIGSSEELLRLAGAKDVHLEIVRGGTGPSCEMLASWT